MKEKTGEVFSVARDNPPVPGCTVSKAVHDEGGYHVVYFSLAAHTDISAETYLEAKLLLVAEGDVTVYTKTDAWHLSAGEMLVTPVGVPVGMRSDEGAVYTEIGLRKESVMNQILESGKVFQLKDLLPYQEGKIVNMDLIADPKLKFVLMSFGAGTGLSEHAAPGEALIFALDGEGIIGYEGKEHTIKAGENFKFAKNGRHYVRAKSDFKMALLLTLE